MNVTELHVTCTACPVQIEGRTDTGLFVYGRFRSRIVQIGIGIEPPGIRDVPGNPVAIAMGLQPGDRFELHTISDDIGVLDLKRWLTSFVHSLP